MAAAPASAAPASSSAPPEPEHWRLGKRPSLKLGLEGVTSTAGEMHLFEAQLEQLRERQWLEGGEENTELGQRIDELERYLRDPSAAPAEQSAPSTPSKARRSTPEEALSPPIPSDGGAGSASAPGTPTHSEALSRARRASADRRTKVTPTSYPNPDADPNPYPKPNPNPDPDPDPDPDPNPNPDPDPDPDPVPDPVPDPNPNPYPNPYRQVCGGQARLRRRLELAPS